MKNVLVPEPPLRENDHRQYGHRRPGRSSPPTHALEVFPTARFRLFSFSNKRSWYADVRSLSLGEPQNDSLAHILHPLSNGTTRAATSCEESKAMTAVKRPRAIFFRKSIDVPNSPLPVLIYRSILPSNSPDKARRFRAVFARNQWSGIWTDTMYDYTHFHSNAHEALGIAKGRVSVLLGGENGRVVRLKAGDLLVLPAGVGHRRVGPDNELRVVGAYPRGQAHFDVKRTGKAVPRVPLPKTDPFYGAEGPVLVAWNKSSAAP